MARISFAVEDIVLLDLDVCVFVRHRRRGIEWNECGLLRNKSLKKDYKNAL